MTWTKSADDFPDDLYRDGLSDGAYRAHHEALSWSNRHLLDGRIPRRDLRRALLGHDPDTAVAELVAAGYWRDAGTHLEVVHHIEHQPTRDEVLRRRQVDAARQARKREADLARAENRLASARDSGSDSTRESRRDTARESQVEDPRDLGSGRDGTGRARTGYDETPSWPPPRTPADPASGRPLDRWQVSGRSAR